MKRIILSLLTLSSLATLGLPVKAENVTVQKVSIQPNCERQIKQDRLNLNSDVKELHRLEHKKPITEGDKRRIRELEKNIQHLQKDINYLEHHCHKK